MRIFSLHTRCDVCLLWSLVFSCSGMGMMGNMGGGRGNFGGVQGHFNPAFMQAGQTGSGLGQFGPDGPRKRYRMDESG